MSQLTVARVRPARLVRGRLSVPGDKSISHRYALLGALADGATTIRGYSPGADCRSTLSCLARLGVPIDERDGVLILSGRGIGGLRAADAALDCGNSGTTMRLMVGVLAGHEFASRLVGDASLSTRPMRRVIEPITRMGGRIEATDGHAPLVVHGRHGLQGITHEALVPSAQVKSAILLAGLHATGQTVVVEAAATRDHTERALEAFGVAVERDGRRISVRGGSRLQACDVSVPGDFSSAAFWLVAAAALPGSRVEVFDVGLNRTRIGLLDVLRRFGARVTVEATETVGGEPRGAVIVEGDRRRAIEVTPEEVPGLIDELPAVAALAAHGGRVEGTRGGRAARERERSDRDARRGLPRFGRRRGRAARWLRRGRPFWRGGVRRTGPRARRSPDGHGLRDRRARRAGAVYDRRRGRRRDFLPWLFRDSRPAAVVTADKVYLVGFMGAGKTSVARALARRLDWRIVDVDALIEAREHRKVAEIFSTKGEPYFRALERTVLLDHLPERHVVVATGGGTFVDAANREAINRDGLSVWLDVPLKTLVERVPPDGRRPLAQDRPAFERLYQVRREAYRHARLHIQAGRRSVHDIVDEIVERLRQE